MDIESLLQSFQHFGVHLGLSRIVKLLVNLGNPHHQVPIIHVAGTNGKGSVCAYLSSVLTEAGYRIGRYTSPHLVDWTERICCNEQPISSEELSELLQQVQAAISPDDEYPTQFEVITAAAWLYFAQQQVDVAVVEVGLGGRLDATNVCSQPLVSIITSISREHWQQLGPTVADIAREKAGILKYRCPAVVGPLPADAQKVVRSRVQELECPIFTPQPARQIQTGWAEYQTLENSKSIKYPLPLQGQIQLTNSALALAALEILQKQGWQISETAIINGIAKTKWPGRMQWITWRNQKLLIDGAHNPAAAQVLRDYVDSLNPNLNPIILNNESDSFTNSNSVQAQSIASLQNQHVTWVIGMLSTKEHADIFKALLQPKERLYLVPVPDSSSANPLELAKIAVDVCPKLSFCETYPDLFSALESAFVSPENLVVLCGSLYLLGHFLATSNTIRNS
ncbi:bifunctional folylpolyglutamate synthase/dihydrofolate synthase [Nostocaceae cyanobacterium CENA369]|uniref:Dihydrofolate synthase/folylpolyglutamate synthase n=1 Tax=Dendronalium phyllosphericum CENA369 TaxID=1725256 RepID=A0A8J7I8L6_9NOST|nr:folylpolyglutamate synthase/dihydrofolate synthase family protein [Dendronalium phyllosphericum]MBH8575933.1 bifunctional folylpolyglutamate synthase/dihydrofolate synthase [Dendronalium phyllosphericum CENA369]